MSAAAAATARVTPLTDGPIPAVKRKAGAAADDTAATAAATDDTELLHKRAARAKTSRLNYEKARTITHRFT